MNLPKPSEMFDQGFGLTPVPYLHGLDEAKNVFNQAVAKGLPIVLKGDPDVDGLKAYKVVADMLTKRGYQFHSTVNKNRLHGLVDAEFVKTERTWSLGDEYIPVEWHQNELIINVDSSISGSEMQMLVENGCYVISLDHHELELGGFLPTQQVFNAYDTSNPTYGFGADLNPIGRGIIINNQYEFEPSELRFWSGTGVALQAMSYILDLPIEKEWLVMHGVSLLSDVRDIENPLARELLALTYNTPLKELPCIARMCDIAQFETPEIFRRSIDHLDRMFVDFIFSPYYNACYQLNLGEYLFDLVHGKRVMLYSAKTARKKIVNQLKKHIKVSRLSRLLLLMVDLNGVEATDESFLYDFSYTSFLGLVANSYLTEGKTVAIFAKDGNKFLRGSVRGISQEVDYRSIFAQAGFEVKGHKGAFGITSLPSKPDFKAVDQIISSVESSGISKPKFVKVKDLLESQSELLKIADDNQYVLSQNSVGILYTGMQFSVKVETAKTKTYTVSGMSVFTYDKELDPKNSLIIPTLESDKLVLTLKKL